MVYSGPGARTHVVPAARLRQLRLLCHSFNIVAHGPRHSPTTRGCPQHLLLFMLQHVIFGFAVFWHGRCGSARCTWCEAAAVGACCMRPGAQA